MNEVERLRRSFFWGQRHNEKRTAWVAWEYLQLSKKDGGLGMRDLKVFNKALLAKQAWRILNNTQSLMVQTLKSKYFPNSSFMDAKVSPNASFTWGSILSARDVIERGAKKVVGSGTSIDIWRDPWIPSLPNFRVLPRQGIPSEAPRLASELMHDGKWNSEVLSIHFSTWEVDAISRIPVANYACEDRWSWHYTRHGDLSVRSAYHLE